MTDRARGLVVAAPASGCGKTLLTLGLLRAWRRRGRRVGAFKVGPDFIDPAFHQAASGRSSWNLDSWAMRPGTLEAGLASVARDVELVVGEGVMGLFDGAPDGRGSTADVARRLELPVVLVVDASAQAASAAALVHGFASFDPRVRVAAVVFNRVGSARHAALLEQACAPLGIPVAGSLGHAPDLAVPERHLGLVQAQEHPRLEELLERAADAVERGLDLALLESIAAPISAAGPGIGSVPPLGRSIAVARDAAFSFVYPALVAGWRDAGAHVSHFSPLAGEAPPEDCDAIYLPGGYPELHAARLAALAPWQVGLRAAAARGACIYGECGGYMALGRALRDADARVHRMAGLLPLETSLVRARRTLGYRTATLRVDTPWAPAGARFAGHEFHYAGIDREGPGHALFDSFDAAGACVGSAGLWTGRVGGSFVHLIDRIDTPSEAC